MPFFILCPACGQSMKPGGLYSHLKAGKSCTRAHTDVEARELMARAPRDPAPWIAAVEATQARLDEAVRRANDKALSKEMRAHWAAIAHMIKSIELLALEEIGPDRYEIPRPANG